jgi:hypothetical protein
VPFLTVEREWKAANRPLTLTIFPNTSNHNLETANLFNVVESSGNYVFEDDEPLRAPRAKVVSYALRAYKVFIDSVVGNFKRGSFNWKLRGLVPFLIVE